MLTDSAGNDVLDVFNEYTYTLETPGFIHSKLQLTAYGFEVDDKPTKLGGKQRIICHNHGSIERIFPLQVENGLCYLPKRLPTVKEANTLPQQIMTSVKVKEPLLFNTYMTLEELIRSFPVSTSRLNGFFDEEGDLILKVSKAKQRRPDLNHLDSDELLYTRSVEDFYNIENSISKEALCTFQDDTDGLSPNGNFSANHTQL